MGDKPKPQKTESRVTLTSGCQVPDSSGSWWSRRSSLERNLSIVTSILVMMALGLIAAVLLVTSSAVPPSPLAGTASQHVIRRRSVSSAYQSDAANCSAENSKVCFTKGCVKAANTILQNMDPDVDPCEDFYSFACGTFTKNRVIPDDKSSVSQFSIIAEQLKFKMRKLIEANVTENDSFAIQLTKNLYASCVDTETIEDRGVKPLKDVLTMMGGWPVVEAARWKEDTFSWTDAIHRNRALGYSVDYIINFSVGTDLKNSTWRIIDFDQASLGLPRKYLLKGFDNADIQAYYTYMVGMAELLGADKDAAKEELKESLLFEIQLANISLAAEDRRNATKLYNKMTLKELGELMPEVNWVTYTNNILRAAGHKISEEEPIIVDVPEFVKNLTNLLKNTPKRVQANYMMWRVVYGSVGMLNEEARDIQLKFSAKLTGTTRRQPRWKECLGGAMNSMSLAAGSLYVKNYFDSSSRRTALEMVKHIHEEFNMMLDNLDWMDNKTKEKAKNKSKAIKYHIGYPEELLNDTALSDVYDGLHMDREHYFENNINMSVFGTNYILSKLRDQIDKNDWKTHSSAAVVNAFYSPIENSIQFPAGILQGAFYDYDRPKYMNYGGIGFVIGHEITHGFDDSGRQFNADGDLAEWWEPDTKKNFLERTKCIIEQYNNVTVPEIGLQINGKLTQGENIADNGGIKEARLAYERYERDNGEEKALPGLQRYTNMQLFWIAAANSWCSVRKPESMKNLIMSDSHSPPFARINVVLSNQKEFAKDWQCSKDAVMSPRYQCAVW